MLLQANEYPLQIQFQLTAFLDDYSLLKNLHYYALIYQHLLLDEFFQCRYVFVRHLLLYQSNRFHQLVVYLEKFGKQLDYLDKSNVYDQKLFRSEEHTSELQSRFDLVCRLLLEKKKIINLN